MSLPQRIFDAIKPAPGAPETTDASTRVQLYRVDAAQRIRVGLTGLAAIFLLVLIAAAGMRPSASLTPQDVHGEPLAVLGVAPGAGSAAQVNDAQPRLVRPSRS